MFAVLHSDINSKSGLLHLITQPIAIRVDQQKSKMESETKTLGTISLIDTHTEGWFTSSLRQLDL